MNKFTIFENDEIVADSIADRHTAHNLAECYSYLKHRNALYALFGIVVRAQSEIASACFSQLESSLR